MIKKIISRQNEAVKKVFSLQSSKGRKKAGHFIAQGVRTCATLLQSVKLIQLYVTEDMLHEGQTLLDTASLSEDNLLTYVSNPIMEKISTTKSSSGIVGVFKKPKTEIQELGNGLVLVRISDPGNMGTLIRTCAAMNGKSVVVIEGCDPWSPKVVQATAGTIGAVTVHELSWDELLAKKGDSQLNALVVKGGEKPETMSEKNNLLVIGNESHGIPTKWVDQCDAKITLSMPGKTESLNAAVAGSIVLYLAFAE